MQRYFIETCDANGQFEVTGDDFFHMTKVMRQVEGSKFYAVINGRSGVAEIKEICDKTIVANVIEWSEDSSEMPVEVTIACGLPKGDKLDLIVQKGTELGADKFVPFSAKRSVVKWDAKKSGKKIERLQKIAKEAAEQSHRNVIPTVEDVVDIKCLIELSGSYDCKLVAYEETAREGESGNLVNALSKIQKGEKMLIVFGPEGGIDGSEIEKLKEAGFVLCGLGPRIMRAETAPLYALSAISYALELK